MSTEILKEYREVLARPKFGLSETLIGDWLRLLDTMTTLAEAPTGIEFPRDRKDAKFLECALSAEADFLITGDRDFESAQRILKTTILSVPIFERRVCKMWGVDRR